MSHPRRCPITAGHDWLLIARVKQIHTLGETEVILNFEYQPVWRRVRARLKYANNVQHPSPMVVSPTLLHTAPIANPPPDWVIRCNELLGLHRPHEWL